MAQAKHEISLARKNPARELVDSIQEVINLLYSHDLSAEKCVGRLVNARTQYILFRAKRKQNGIQPRRDQLQMTEMTTA